MYMKWQKVGTLSIVLGPHARELLVPWLSYGEKQVTWSPPFWGTKWAKIMYILSQKNIFFKFGGRRSQNRPEEYILALTRCLNPIHQKIVGFILRTQRRDYTSVGNVGKALIRTPASLCTRGPTMGRSCWSEHVTGANWSMFLLSPPCLYLSPTFSLFLPPSFSRN